MSELPRHLEVFLRMRAVTCTKSMYFLIHDCISAFDLLLFTVNLASRADEGAMRAASTLLKIARDDKEKTKYEQTISRINNNKGEFGRLKSMRNVNSRHLLTAIVESFNCYITHLLTCVLLRRPEMLKSSEKIALEDLFDFKTKKELVAYLAERKVHTLSYGGVKELERYFSDVLGIKMFENEDQKKLLVTFMELRNIHVHNRGYINRIFLNRVSSSHGFHFELNKRFQIDLDEIAILSENLLNVVLRLDRIVALKFSLDRKKYINWNKAPPKFI